MEAAAVILPIVGLAAIVFFVLAKRRFDKTR